MHALKTSFLISTVFAFAVSFGNPASHMAAHAGAAAAPDSIAVLLAEIAEAQGKVAYRGVFSRTWQHADRTVHLKWRIDHWPGQGKMIAFFEPEDLAETWILYKNGETRVYEKGEAKRALRYGKRYSMRSTWPINEIDLLQQNYRIAVSPGEPYLGRSTLSIAVTPKYRGRPSVRVLVDRETKLLLRMRKDLPAVGAKEINQFTEITFQAGDVAAFDSAWAATPAKAGAKRRDVSYSDLASLLAAREEPVLVPQKLPAGFRLRSVRSYIRHDRPHLHFIYSDGLAFVSLFESYASPRNKSGDQRSSRKRGRASPFSIVRGRMEGIGYSLVSEIQKAELEEMASSLIAVGRVEKRLPVVQLLLAGVILFATVIFLRKKMSGRDV